MDSDLLVLIAITISEKSAGVPAMETCKSN